MQHAMDISFEGKESVIILDNNNKFWKGAAAGAISAFLVCCCIGVLVAGMVAANLSKRQALQQQSQSGGQSSSTQELNVFSSEINDKMAVIQELINSYYYFDIDEQKVADGLYTGLLYGLDDPYSVYYNEENYTSMMETSEGRYCGIGVMVSQNIKTGVITVVRPFKNGPGYEAGMAKDDIIYAVNGEEVTGKDINVVVSEMKGEEGTPVTVTIYREATNEYIDMTMNRRIVESETVTSNMLKDNIGYIELTEFDDVTYNQFMEAVQSLESQGMKKLVVDLRGNLGGNLDSVTSILDEILPEGLLISIVDKNDKGEKYYSDEKKQMNIPMAVLVNGNSASASEVFAGAIQDYQWGTIVGTQSYGKGIVQSVIPLGDGTGVKITMAKYLTPNGRDVHKIGITPDVVVELDESLAGKNYTQDEDNQLQEAVRILEEQ